MFSEISPLFASASCSAASTKASSDSSISNMLRPLATSSAVIEIGAALMLLYLLDGLRSSSRLRRFESSEQLPFERRDIRCELFSGRRRIDQPQHLFQSRVHQIQERERKGLRQHRPPQCAFIQVAVMAHDEMLQDSFEFQRKPGETPDMPLKDLQAKRDVLDELAPRRVGETNPRQFE